MTRTAYTEPRAATDLREGDQVWTKIPGEIGPHRWASVTGIDWDLPDPKIRLHLRTLGRPHETVEVEETELFTAAIRR